MESLIFPGDATSPTPFGLSSTGLWDEVEVSGDGGLAAVFARLSQRAGFDQNTRNTQDLEVNVKKLFQQWQKCPRPSHGGLSHEACDTVRERLAAEP